MFEATTGRELEQLDAGHAGYKWKKYQQCDDQMKALLHSFKNRLPRKFLPGIAHIFAFSVEQTSP